MARFVLLLLIISLIAQLQSCGVDAVQNVKITLLESAVAKGAVCLDGSPPAYAFSPGFGDGVDNWHVFIQGGGWCCDLTDSCLGRMKGGFGSGSVIMKENNGMTPFDGMLDNNSTFNPDFYNWNVFYIFYCDGSSFMSNVEEVDRVTKIHYRGARIYDAMMEELLGKGIGNAKNVLLSGLSAGGLTTMLHCDKFRALFPSSTRVKCLSDSGFFLHAKHLRGAEGREKRFAKVISEHKLANLPKSCTDKFDPALCLFPEYFAQDIQTPLFLLESAFDAFQVAFGLLFQNNRTKEWLDCSNYDVNLCNSADLEIMKEFRNTFIEILKNTTTNSSYKRGYFVHSCYMHGHMGAKGWSTCSIVLGNNVLAGKTVAQALGDWYFDRSEFKEIDIRNEFPRKCSNTIPPGQEGGPEFDAKCSAALHPEIVGISKLDL